ISSATGANGEGGDWLRKKAGPGCYVFLVGFVCVILLPSLWQCPSSLNPPGALFAASAFKLSAPNPTPDTYVRVFTQCPFGSYLWNSFVVASLTTIYCVFVAAIAAYAIARLHFRGKTLVLGLFLMVSMFPQIATIAPIYLFVKSVNLTNSYLGLVIPYTTFALPLAVWNLTAFY